MCGIAGYVSEYSIDEAVLEQMVDSLWHRGPDSMGTYRNGSYAAGMRRLSINGLETGDQPLFNHDRSIVVFYNGEIYNSPQLRRELKAKGYQFRTESDGEVISHLYEEYGTKVFERLDGMFAIAIWSVKEKKLILARDIPGEKPLYYSQLSNNGLVFGSELRVFKQFPKLDLSLDYQSLWDFPTFLWIPEPSTVYKEVKAVPRGHYLTIDSSGTTSHQFPNRFSEQIPEASNWQELVDLTRQIVTDSVKSRLLSQVPVGSFLSSGLDSSIVATIAQQELGNLSTFSIGFEDVDDPYHGNADESSAARVYAKQLGTKHHEIHVTGDDFYQALPEFCDYGDQPFAVSSGLGILFVAKAAREQGIKILLSGDGADESFGGYSWYSHLNSPYLSYSASNDEPHGVISFQNFGLEAEIRLRAMSRYKAPQRAWAWHYYAAEEEKAALFSREAFNDVLESHRYFSDYNSASQWHPEIFVNQDKNFYLPNEMMRKLDKMTMAHSVEGRAPFVAPSVLALAEQFRYKHMVKGEVLKPVLREAFAGLLPADISERPKHGFNVPIDHWLKGSWSGLMEEAFSRDSALSKMGLISNNSGAFTTQMLADPQRLNGHTLFCYVMLNMWLERSWN